MPTRRSAECSGGSAGRPGQAAEYRSVALFARFLELFSELLVMLADPFARAVVGVPTHICAEPARRRRAAECLGHRADVVGCAAATDTEVVDSERSRRRRERAHLVAVG